MKYNLQHLTQDPQQNVIGPIQDDEALLLYSIIRVMRYKNIIEIGYLDGYSALNFLNAIEEDGHLVSIDIDRFQKLSNNHTALCKSASDVSANDIPFKHADIIFYDCHDYDSQMCFHENMINSNIITNETLLVLHDTGLHPYQVVYGHGYEIEKGWVHQQVERKMVNDFVNAGWNTICFNTNKEIHDEKLPYRHGITIMKKFEKLIT